MGKKVVVRAVAGRTVRNPVTGAILPADWVTIEDSSFWQKRIAQGDVEQKSESAPVQKVKEMFEQKTKYFEGVKKDD